MAAKKIGAIIALDGEKEFRQNVTSCNKTLTSLKSEMKLVSAETEGQANSLEALTKKNEIYTKILDEQKKKEDETRKGLEHAREEYNKVSDGLKTLNLQQDHHQKRLDELQKSYKEATDQLEKLEKAGDSSEKSITQQRKVVESLNRSMDEEILTLEEINAAISKGEKNYRTASNRISDWEAKLNTARAQTVKANRELNKNAAYMKEAENSTDKCATSIDEFGREVKKAEEVTVSFGTVIKSNLYNTVTDLAKNAISSAVESTLDMESAQNQLQASTGATKTEMTQYKKVMDELHRNNYGDDINDVAESMALVKQYMGDLDSSSLKEITEDGIAMRDVFQMDLGETIRGVDVLIDKMGLTSEDAFDLMAKGAQNGLNKTGELGDNIAEYGPLWAQAGFSAKEMFSIMQNGLDSGAYSLDKVNDFVKEFGNSLADGRIEESLESFSFETQNIFKEWKTGKATTKDVFNSVIHDLDTATNKQEMLTLASETWSALGEDNAMDMITSLADVNDAYENVQGTMEEIKEIKYDDLQNRFKTLGKKFQTDVAMPIAEKALPAIEEGFDFVIDNMDTLAVGIGSVAAGVVVFKTVSGAINTLKASTEGATAAQGILNITMNANPIIAVTTAIAAAGTALVLYTELAGEATQEVQRLTEANEKVTESANKVSEEAKELTTNYADTTAEMQAQAEYADSLAEKIQTLADKENLSNAEKSVMQQYIAELNNLVPGLNIAYDEQSQKLNLTNTEIEKYLENSQKQIELQAAQEHAIELLQKKSELEIEAIKLENQKAEIMGVNGEAEITMKDKIAALTMGLTSGNMDFYQSVKAVSEAQKENSEAMEENRAQQESINESITATSEYLAQFGINWSDVTAKVNENSEATQNNANTQSQAAEASILAAQTIAENYTGIQQKVSEVLEAQMNMFQEFNAGTEITSVQLLQNMQSQIDGVTNWADNLAILADRGINQGILQELSEMGPEGSSYVQAFANMTDDQLKRASEMWEESLDMRQGVNESVEDMIESYTTALSGGKDRVSKAMEDLGYDSVKGLVQGVSANLKDAKDSGTDIGNSLESGANERLDRHSPSKVFKEIGEDVVSGLVNGISGSRRKAVSEAKSLAGDVVDAVERQLKGKKFDKAGKSVAEGIADGIKSSRGEVREAVRAVCELVENAAYLNEYTLYSEGLNVSYGLANGISNGESSVINAVSRVCQNAVYTARGRLGIHSPSTVFAQLGGYTAEGFAQGYERKMPEINQMIRDSIEIPERSGIGTQRTDAASWADNQRITIELPIYAGKTYTKTEILEISKEGISRSQINRNRYKGMRANAVRI